ncbi:hypothetical protein V8C37DRAFT_385142, partial [Trichoderma ceciliae]
IWGWDLSFCPILVLGTIMRDTAASRNAIVFSFGGSSLFTFFFWLLGSPQGNPNETLSTFLGFLGQLDWPRNTRHGMEHRLPHSPTLTCILTSVMSYLGVLSIDSAFGLEA